MREHEQEVIRLQEHRQFTAYVDLPSSLSQEEVFEMLGAVDVDMADHPEEPSGGSYFHGLQAIEEPAEQVNGRSRYFLHLNLFYGADWEPLTVQNITEDASKALSRHLVARGFGGPPAWIVVCEDSRVVSEPDCYWCNHEHEEGADGDEFIEPLGDVQTKGSSGLNEYWSYLLDASKIRRLRLQRGFSVKELARKVWVSPSVVDKFEASNSHANNNIAKRLSVVLGVELSALVLHHWPELN